jgi:signal transduction histidine kinase
VDEVQPRVARAMMWSALGLIFLIRLLTGIVHGWSTDALLLAMASYPPLVVLVARRWPDPARYGLFGLVAGLAVLPFAVVGTAWDWLPWTVGVAILVTFRGRAAVALFAGLLGVVLAGGLLAGGPVSGALWRVTATVNDGLIIFSLRTLAGMVAGLTTARGELARLATLRERLRLDGQLRTTVEGELRAIGDRLTAGRGGIREAVEIARRALVGIRAAAGEYRTAGVPVGPTGLRSPRIVRLVLLGVLLMQATAAGAYVATIDPVQLFVMVPVLAAIVMLYLVPPFRYQLVVIAALSFPVVWPGTYLVPAWGIDGMWGFFIGLVVLRLRPPASWALVASVLGLHVVLCLTPPPVLPPTQIATGLVSDLILGSLVYSLTRLGELVALLDRARHDLADEAVSKERARIARDLHDVLGFSLSAVALRGELALRLLDRDPARAAAELEALRVLVGRSVYELGSIAEGRIKLRLAEEVEAAHRVLAAAGVTAEITVETGPLDQETDTALAAVLRESVTNVLRHSQARTCAIAVTEENGSVRLTVTNDGVTRPAPAQRDGLGLASLAVRTGGRLTAGPLAGGRFRLVAQFASDPARLAGDADGVDAIAGAELGHR